MSARKQRKGKVMNMKEKQDMLKDLFPEIDADVVKLMLESCDGDVDEAHNHLRELDLEIWAAKNSKPLLLDGGHAHVLPDTLAGPKINGDEFPSLDESTPSSSFDHLPGEPFPPTQKLSFSSDGGSDSSSSSALSSGKARMLPDVDGVAGGDTWTGESSSSDFGLSDSSNGPSYPLQEAAVNSGFQLSLDKDLAVKLVMTFGLMQVPIDINDADNLVVNLDMNLGYKLYQAWKATQEALIMQAAPETAISEDEKLARCLQECEHETYAEQGMKEKSLQEIMDETYALSLAEKDSNGHGMDLPSALQYQSSGGVESKWVDVLLRSHNMSPDSGYPGGSSAPKNVYAPGTAHSFLVDQPAPKAEVSVVRPSSAKTITVTPVSSNRQSPLRTTPAGKIITDPVDYFGERHDAIQLQKKAIEYGARAGQAYADKKIGGGAAAYYLQRSHEHKSLAKEAHLAASMNILSSRNLNAGDGEIDLHGLRMEEVGVALDDFFERRHTVKEIKIISGRGAHSRTGTSEVRRTVHVYLTKHGFKFNEGPPEGVFYVQKWQKSKLKPP